MPRQNFACFVTLVCSEGKRCCPTKNPFADGSSWRWRSRFFARATCLRTRLKRPCAKSTTNRNSAASAVRNANGDRMLPADGSVVTEARRNTFAVAGRNGIPSTRAVDVRVAAIIGCGQRACGAASILLTKIGTPTKKAKRRTTDKAELMKRRTVRQSWMAYFVPALVAALFGWQEPTAKWRRRCPITGRRV